MQMWLLEGLQFAAEQRRLVSCYVGKVFSNLLPLASKGKRDLREKYCVPATRKCRLQSQAKLSGRSL
jgi:hypothetical protein